MPASEITNVIHNDPAAPDTVAIDQLEATPVPRPSDSQVRLATRATHEPPPAVKEFDALKGRIHNKLVALIRPEDLRRAAEQGHRGEVRQITERLVDQEAPLLNIAQRRQLLTDLMDDIFGLGPLEKLLRDPTLCDILVNSPREVFVERRGKLEPADVHFRDDQHLLEVIHRILDRLGRRVDESSPMVDARLADGSRVNAIIPPLALKGPTLSIRRFPSNPLKLKELLAVKSLTPEMAQLLEAAAKAKLNILISGGTGSGKTTLLNWLSGAIPNDQRIITIEDAAELQLQQRHVVQLESRPPNIEGKGEITIRDLLKNALRMRPDRIIVGECRGSEALDMLQAMNTGHEGSMTTLHANSPRDALSRLEMMIMMAGIELPVKVMRQQIASAVNLIVQLERLPGGSRKIVSVTEVVGMEENTITLQEIFVFKQSGVDSTGKAVGQFEATGVRPYFHNKMKAAGIDLNPALFQHRVLMRV